MYADNKERWRGRKVVVRYGQPGHEHEFCANVAGYDLDDFIPNSLARALEEALPHEFRSSLLNRGSRLELYGGEELRSLFEQALADIGLEVVAAADFPWE